MIKSAVKDVRILLFLIFLVFVASIIFTELKESNPDMKEDIEDIEEGTYDGLKIFLWGVGIIGTIGLIIWFHSLFGEKIVI